MFTRAKCCPTVSKQVEAGQPEGFDDWLSRVSIWRARILGLPTGHYVEDVSILLDVTCLSLPLLVKQLGDSSHLASPPRVGVDLMYLY